jgi:type II secretory pathway component PulF
MAQFTVTAKRDDGETLELTRIASSRSALVSALRAEGLTPVSVADASDPPGLLSSGNGTSARIARPRKKALHAFLSNLAVLLRSGMDLERCLRTLERESKGPMRSIIAEMLRRVRQGDRLSEAMVRTGAFSDFHTRVVRAGEYGGDLHEALGRIAATVEREAEIRGKIRNAVAYPAFLVVLGSASFVLMLTLILPKFAKMYEELGSDLPLATDIMLRTSQAVTAHAFWLLPLVGVLAFVMIRAMLQFRESTRIDRLRMRIPLLGNLVRDIEAAAFLRNLGLLVQSGLPVSQALAVCAQVADSAVFADAAREIERGVHHGESLSAEMRRTDLFSETILNLVAVGEESGNLAHLMLDCSETMERRMDDLIRGALTILEPVLILAVGCLIGLMAMATVLPIFSLSSGIRR